VCRALAYLGEPLLLDDVLFKADSSLVRQATDPKLMTLLNLGGFGLAAWDAGSPDPEVPFTYRTPAVPAFDRNLKALAEKVRATALLAHVRGVVYDPRESVGPQNLHPFRFADACIALAQNGDLADFGAMRFDLLEHVRPELAARVEGTTDTEWAYALVLSQLEDPLGPADPEELAQAVQASLIILRRLRERRGIAVQSPINLVASDGRCLIATRFVYDYGWYLDDDSFFAGEREHDFTTLWYTTGGSYEQRDGEWALGENGAASIMVASEPLTRDRSAWLEAPAYSMLVARPANGRGLEVETRELEL
jgi:glutamine amidotransferase